MYHARDILHFYMLPHLGHGVGKQQRTSIAPYGYPDLMNIDEARCDWSALTKPAVNHLGLGTGARDVTDFIQPIFIDQVKQSADSSYTL